MQKMLATIHKELWTLKPLIGLHVELNTYLNSSIECKKYTHCELK
jgi:hypothetical protein